MTDEEYARLDRLIYEYRNSASSHANEWRNEIMSFVESIACQREIMRAAGNEVLHAAATRPCTDWQAHFEMPMIHLRWAVAPIDNIRTCSFIEEAQALLASMPSQRHIAVDIETDTMRNARDNPHDAVLHAMADMFNSSPAGVIAAVQHAQRPRTVQRRRIQNIPNGGEI